ncbi:ABC transporter substrate-binding protein [Mesorhizobium xinjiangense]|uniref:ABC transporter substrate-binding protein n=1 Tax=Mesorhizobium xinjiangense TaxID=2678685 RepID=UPI0018DBECC4|nr:ABC transporter substrate-binding protein [Mesorhizobium xinjiangense]
MRGTAAALLSGAVLVGSGLATSAAAQAKTITAVMHSGLRVLDPVITTAHITRDHAYMIYDVLVAVDENFTPQPQMADWTISDDNLIYTFTLRDGLTFHDGAPVTAADAVASLKRWGQKDSGGQLIFDVTESLEAADDKTIVWTLKEPFAPLLDTIAKQSALPPFIMPERIAANTPADTAITEYVGSGPFVFVEDEYQPGVSVTYRKFEDYVPREEEPSWMAGGKNVKVDEVKWVTMPDAQTAINAIMSGEIDYLEQAPVDLLPILETSEDVTIEVRDDLGYQTIGRMNFKYPPFDNKEIRQAAMMALSQEDVLATLIGNPDYYKVCGAIFGCGTPLGDETGSDTLVSGGDIEGAKKLLEEAGYDNTPIVLMQPTDVVTLTAQPVVAAQALRNAGFNVDMQAMDWQTLVTRRASQAKPADGGWNIFFTNWMVPEVDNPLISPMLNGRGDDAWFGWPKDDEIEALRAEFIAAKTLEERQEVAKKIQIHTMDSVNYIPLGQYYAPQARSNKLEGMLMSPVPVFWNIDKVD